MGVQMRLQQRPQDRHERHWLRSPELRQSQFDMAPAAAIAVPQINPPFFSRDHTLTCYCARFDLLHLTYSSTFCEECLRLKSLQKSVVKKAREVNIAVSLTSSEFRGKKGRETHFVSGFFVSAVAISIGLFHIGCHNYEGQ